MAYQAKYLNHPAGPYGPYGKNYPDSKLIERVVFHIIRLSGRPLHDALHRLWPPMGKLFGFKPGPIDILVGFAYTGLFIPWKDLPELDSEKK